jgi:hypothetical protein
LRPSSQNTPTRQVKALVVEEEVYQNQRYIPVIGWTSAYMLPADRKQFSTHEGGMSSDSFPEVKALPQGWHWDGDWFVDTTGCHSPARLRDAQVRANRCRHSLHDLLRLLRPPETRADV